MSQNKEIENLDDIFLTKDKNKSKKIKKKRLKKKPEKLSRLWLTLKKCKSAGRSGMKNIKVKFIMIGEG
ncbi:hypothetical protein LLUC023_04555 [Lactococcus cremoris]|uniref:hypothetical protein n=1 Tax=Lactococcus lactis subsp. cremoris TaxID=1359 RepID=UPI0037C0725C